MKHVVEHMSDDDLYKLTMLQTVYHHYSKEHVEYKFKCRNDIPWTEQQLSRIEEEIDWLCSLQYTQEELDYLSKIRYFKHDFIDFLSLVKLNRKHIKVWLDSKNRLQIKIKGSWMLTILFEVHVLSIVNEVFFEDKPFDKAGALKRLDKKIELAKLTHFKFSDFGTRRRFSREWHETVIQKLVATKHETGFIGTSNVYFAMKYNLTPIGTMAHEYLMANQQSGVRLVDFQKKALQTWVDEYRGDLGYALTDTVGFDAFLKDFDSYFAKLYDGLRHDSGDPYEWGEKAIAHYHSLGIDPVNKYLVFSDGLNFVKAAELHDHFSKRINVSFGIGTNLTNDVPGLEALNIVIKLVSVNDNPVAKISDSPGKGMCEDDGFLAYIKKVFGLAA